MANGNSNFNGNSTYADNSMCNGNSAYNGNSMATSGDDAVPSVVTGGAADTSTHGVAVADGVIGRPKSRSFAADGRPVGP